MYEKNALQYTSTLVIICLYIFFFLIVWWCFLLTIVELSILELVLQMLLSDNWQCGQSQSGITTNMKKVSQNKKQSYSKNSIICSVYVCSTCVHCSTICKLHGPEMTFATWHSMIIAIYTHTRFINLRLSALNCIFKPTRQPADLHLLFCVFLEFFFFVNLKKKTTKKQSDHGCRITNPQAAYFTALCVSVTTTVCRFALAVSQSLHCAHTHLLL